MIQVWEVYKIECGFSTRELLSFKSYILHKEEQYV